MFATILSFEYLLWAGVCWAIGYKVQRDFFFFLTSVLVPLCSFPCFVFPLEYLLLNFITHLKGDSRKMPHKIKVKISFLLSYQPEAGEPESHSMLCPIL